MVEIIFSEKLPEWHFACGELGDECNIFFFEKSPSSYTIKFSKKFLLTKLFEICPAL